MHTVCYVHPYVSPVSHGFGKRSASLHMCMIAAAVANDGVMMEPRLLFSATTPAGKQRAGFESVCISRGIPYESIQQDDSEFSETVSYSMFRVIPEVLLFVQPTIPERKTKMKKPTPTPLPFFEEAIEWCECPFLFNRKFTDEEKNKILEKVREHAIGILEMKRSVVQNLVYDTIEEMGYTTSDM